MKELLILMVSQEHTNLRQGDHIWHLILILWRLKIISQSLIWIR